MKDKVERNGAGTVRERRWRAAQTGISPVAPPAVCPAFCTSPPSSLRWGRRGTGSTLIQHPAYSRYSKERSLLLPFSFGAQEHPCARVKAEG